MLDSRGPVSIWQIVLEVYRRRTNVFLNSTPPFNSNITVDRCTLDIFSLIVHFSTYVTFLPSFFRCSSGYIIFLVNIFNYFNRSSTKSRVSTVNKLNDPQTKLVNWNISVWSLSLCSYFPILPPRRANELIPILLICKSTYIPFIDLCIGGTFIPSTNRYLHLGII